MAADLTPSLAPITWAEVEELNQFMCSTKSHQVGRTSDGYAIRLDELTVFIQPEAPKQRGPRM